MLSPLLFNLFIEDIFETVTSNKVKFADDGTYIVEEWKGYFGDNARNGAKTCRNPTMGDEMENETEHSKDRILLFLKRSENP